MRIKVLRHLEQLLGQRDEFIDRQAAVALVHCLTQRIGYAGADSHHGSLLDAKLHCDGVGALEPNSVIRRAILTP